MPVYRATVKVTYPGGSGVGTNTWHFRTLGAAYALDEVNDNVNAISQFYLSIASLWNSGSRAIFDGNLVEVGTANPEAGRTALAFNRQGTNGTATMGPAGVGACVTWRTALATRSGRGRTFIVPLYSQHYESDGTLTASALSTLQGAATTLVASSTNPSNGALGVWSQKDGVLRDFTAATVNDKVAFLSSRRG